MQQQVQQRHRSGLAAADLHGPAGLWYRPPVIVLSPDGKERVYARGCPDPLANG
jgi:hypothetical protein